MESAKMNLKHDIVYYIREHIFASISCWARIPVRKPPELWDINHKEIFLILEKADKNGWNWNYFRTFAYIFYSYL